MRCSLSLKPTYPRGAPCSTGPAASVAAADAAAVWPVSASRGRDVGQVMRGGAERGRRLALCCGDERGSMGRPEVRDDFPADPDDDALRAHWSRAEVLAAGGGA